MDVVRPRELDELDGHTQQQHIDSWRTPKSGCVDSLGDPVVEAAALRSIRPHGGLHQLEDLDNLVPVPWVHLYVPPFASTDARGHSELLCQGAAVNRERMTGHEARLRRTQPEDGVSLLLRAREALHRDL